MKTTRFVDGDAATTPGTGGGGGPLGGDTRGSLPNPEVSGIDGRPLLDPGTETDGDTIVYDSASGGWRFEPGSTTSDGSMVPYYIAAGDTFTVPLYKQGLFKDTIEVDGILVVLGRLLGVD